MILVVGTHAARSHFLESAPLTCQELPPTLTGRIRLTGGYVLTLLLGSMSALVFAHLRFRPFGFGVWG